MALLIKNGEIVTASERYVADILCEGVARCFEETRNAGISGWDFFGALKGQT